MSVWKSAEKLPIFASLISPPKIIKCLRNNIKAFNSLFHHQLKYLEVRQKYSAARHIFNSLLGVSPGDETSCMHSMLDILHPSDQFCHSVTIKLW